MPAPDLRERPAAGAADTPATASPWAGASTEHYENFPVGSLLVPSRLRPAVAALYRFARHGDDVADEGDRSDADRLAELDAMRRALRGEGPSHPAVEPLRPHLPRHGLEIALLDDLLTAFERDVTIKRHADRAALLDYCRHSANPVGRLMLQLFDVRDARSAELSDAICTALQLVNFWQDVAIDWRKARVYLPQADLAQAGLSDADIGAAVAAGHCPTALRALIATESDWARALLESGRPLVGRVPMRLSLELRAILAGASRVLARLAAADHDPVAARPVLGLRDLPAILAAMFR